MWSDTGSYEFSSPGDRTKSVNLEGFNVTGPVKGSRFLEPSGMMKKSSRPNTYA